MQARLAHPFFAKSAPRFVPASAVALALAFVSPPPALHGQGAGRTAGALPIPAGDARVRAALDAIRADNAWTLDQQASICEVPAPPFKEEARAAEFKRRLESLGVTSTRIDAEGNVIAERRGTGDGPTVVISGHLDTVFPEGTDVAVKREGTLFRAPGIGDDCRGWRPWPRRTPWRRRGAPPARGTVLFVGTVGEEGPGNLRGVRHLFGKELAGKVDYFISVDGTGLGVTSRAVGSHRYKVTYKGPGGHSFGAFGMPNPIHALGRAIAKIGDLQVPADPKTTFNVGVISGGTSVNSIAGDASMEVDMRSESPAALDSLDAKFQAAVRAARDEEAARWPKSNVPIMVQVDTIGIRPAGGQPDTAPIVQAALRTREQVAGGKAGVALEPTSASSTDANIPMSLGIPAITIDGGGVGRGAHSLEESYDDGANGYLGPQWAALLVATLAGVP